MKVYTRKIAQLVLVLTAVVFSACNEEFPNLLDKNYTNQANGTQANKVVVVVVDGLRGNALADIDPENLRIIARNSLYSNSSLGDMGNKPYTRSMGLANIFTGVTSERHEVSGDNLSGVNTTAYPTFINRLKKEYDGFSSMAYTTDAQVNEYLLKDADTKEVVATDDLVVSKTRDAIVKSDAAMVIAHLSDVDKAGRASSYESNDVKYKAAVLKLDGQIKEIVSGITQRPNYKNENWLVVITSSTGAAIANSDPNDLTAYGDNTRNVFTYFYSPKFSRKYIAKPNSTEVPFEGNAVRYTYTDPAVNAKVTNPSAFNFGNNQNFTINFFYKDLATGNHYYPIVLSKRVAGFNGAGWNMFIEGANLGWNSSLGGQLFTTVTPARNGEWHFVTVVVNRTTPRVALFVDGVLQGSNSAGTANLDNTSPLAIGKWAGDGNSNPDFLLSNLQVYNTAFTDQEVKELGGIGLVKDSHPKKANLIGYWPGYEDVGTAVLTDKSGKNNHMTITGSYTWSTFSELVRQFKPDITASFYKIVPNLVDIPFFIYQWYGVVPKPTWHLEGQAWTPPFAILEY